MAYSVKLKNMISTTSFKVINEEKITLSMCFKDFTLETVRNGRRMRSVRSDCRLVVFMNSETIELTTIRKSSWFQLSRKYAPLFRTKLI